METVFDHGITPKEEDKILGGLTKSQFLKIVDIDTSHLLIAKLYWQRDNEKEMMKYVDRLPFDMKMDFLRSYNTL